MYPKIYTVPAGGWRRIENYSAFPVMEIFNDSDQADLRITEEQENAVPTQYRRIPIRSVHYEFAKVVHVYNNTAVAVNLQVRYLKEPGYPRQYLDIRPKPEFQVSGWGNIIPPDIVGTEANVAVPFASAQGGYLSIHIRFPGLGPLANSLYEMYLRYQLNTNPIQPYYISFQGPLGPNSINEGGLVRTHPAGNEVESATWLFPDMGDTVTLGDLLFCVRQTGGLPDVVTQINIFFGWFEGDI